MTSGESPPPLSYYIVVFLSKGFNRACRLEDESVTETQIHALPDQMTPIRISFFGGDFRYSPTG